MSRRSGRPTNQQRPPPSALTRAPQETGETGGKRAYAAQNPDKSGENSTTYAATTHASGDENRPRPAENFAWSAENSAPNPLKFSPDRLKIRPQIRRKFRQRGRKFENYAAVWVFSEGRVACSALLRQCHAGCKAISSIKSPPDQVKSKNPTRPGGENPTRPGKTPPDRQTFRQVRRKFRHTRANFRQAR